MDMNKRQTFVVAAVAVGVMLTGTMWSSSVAGQSRNRTKVVKVFVKADGRNLTKVVDELGREWAGKKESVEIVRRESDADLVVTVGSRTRGRNVSVTLIATFNRRSESFGDEDFGYLVRAREGSDLVFTSKPDVSADRLGGDDVGWLVGKVESWLDKNRARVTGGRL